MKGKIIALFFFFMAFSLYADDNKSELTLKAASEAFQAANSSTVASEKNDLYKQALLNYEQLLNNDGYKNGALYYNIANTYFMLDDIGHAILNYRRALKLSPQDENIKTNLEFARKKRVDQIEQSDKQSAFKMLLFWHYAFANNTKYQIAIFTTALFWIFLTAFILKSNKGFLKFAAVFLIVSIVLASSAYVSEQKTEAVITAQDIIARKGDGFSYEPSFNEPLHAGTELSILEKRTDWLHVMLENGKDTWLPISSVEEI